MRFNVLLIFLAASAFLTSCTAIENDLNKGLAFGTNSVRLASKVDDRRKPGRLPNGVNAFLWRAALNQLVAIPLVTADSQKGLIETDWFSPPASAGERTKYIVQILASDLRPDTFRVLVARQMRGEDGWADAHAQAAVARNLEELIYVRARDLRGW